MEEEARLLNVSHVHVVWHVICKTEEEERLLNNKEERLLNNKEEERLLNDNAAATYLANTRVTDEGQQTKGDNPNEAILPDFTNIEYAMARAHLIARDAWAEQAEIELRQAQEARWVTAEQEQEQQQALEDELIAACKEEHKKNKDKFIPISTAKIPTIPTVIPSHYTVCKLKTGDYCKLFYFINKGLSKAKKNLLSTELQGLILILGADGQQMWVNVDETRNSKTVITKDKNLSWEEFNEATPCMITAIISKLQFSPQNPVTELDRLQCHHVHSKQ
ncbi:hypothetical protein BDR06DRAFT_1061531 [Suillus hirtellus]|nr:hypothetical protein BDR06DRAFT_1061531 [Suillus hirtellus]